MIKNKKILITGGLGFIGSHLVNKLILFSNKIYVIDNFSSRKKEKEDFLKRYKNKIKFIKSNIYKYKNLEGLIKEVDFVFHLASGGGVAIIKNRTKNSILNTFKSSELIFKLCAKYKKRLIFISSSEVYGLNSKKLVEDARPNLGNPKILRWNYAYTKLTEEFLAISYFREKKLKVSIVRLFNTIGEGLSSKSGKVITNFFSQALIDKPLTVYGDGKQTRTFTYVGDVIYSLIKISISKKSYGEIINVGAGEKISIISLAKKIIKITKSNSKIKFIRLNKIYGSGAEDCKQGLPCLKKLQNLINYKPNTNLDNILKKIISTNYTNFNQI